MHGSLAHIEAFGKSHRLAQLQLLQMKINTIIVHSIHLSARFFFLNCMWHPRVSGSGNAKLSTAFDVIRRFILLFAWDMPEIGFVGTAFS